jgi:ABC-type sugar transport system substrate-binding protein
MNITKTLMLAAVTAVTLGAGAAMAQSEVPSAPAPAYVNAQSPAAPQTVNTWRGRVQSGSSDAGAAHSVTHFVPFNGDYTTIDNPG